MADIHLSCDVCHGSRYKEEVLEVKYRGKSISEILEMTVGEAAGFFNGVKNIFSGLKTLNNVGLGYLHLGQSTNNMSGGELQRLKLAKELSSPAKGNTLYLFDEPSTGLHPQDVEMLIRLFRNMADSGHTLLIIEHDADIILQADWVIDLGPGGGEYGGKIVAQGNPGQISKNPNSLTGKYIRGKT
jgi:excinuclease ABC subunit A